MAISLALPFKFGGSGKINENCYSTFSSLEVDSTGKMLHLFSCSLFLDVSKIGIILSDFAVPLLPFPFFKFIFSLMSRA